MPVPIIVDPSNCIELQCQDSTCKHHWLQPMPEPEVVNTPKSACVLYRIGIFDCPRCGAQYRWVVQQVESRYGFARVDNEVVVPQLRAVQ